MPFRMDIRTSTNANWRRVLQIVDDQNNPIPLTGSDFRADFKPADDPEGPPAFTISMANGRIIDVGFAAGYIQISIPKNAGPPGDYIFDMLMTIGGNDYAFAYGTLTLALGITA